MPVKMIAIATINPEAKSSAKSYSESVKGLLPRFGGRPLARHELSELLVGDKPANVVLVVEFESEEKVRNFINSQEYQALVPERDKGFTAMNIFLSL